jgi:hypothetical protein
MYKASRFEARVFAAERIPVAVFNGKCEPVADKAVKSTVIFIHAGERPLSWSLPDIIVE